TRQNTSAADRLFGSAMARRESVRSGLQDCFRREYCSPFARVMAKQRQSAGPEAGMHLAKRHWQGEGPRAPAAPVSGKGAGVRVILVVWQPGKPPHLEARDSLLQWAREILPGWVRAPQYLQGPGPFAFFRETQDAEKCNRAARCGDLPIFVRYHRRCNRRELVGYGNTRSRWPHKRARLAGTFPIAGADKFPCPLHRIEG